MLSKNNKNYFVISSFATVLIVAFALISIFWPGYEMRFLELGLLGEHKTASDYFPNGDYVLSVGSEIQWFIYLHNHLGTTQDVIIRVKLLNSTMDAPDDQKNIPSSQISFIEFPSSLSVNETTLLPFSWSILEADSQEDSSRMQRIFVNDQEIEVDISDSYNFFRMVFELWVYDSSLQEYRFGWESEKGLSSASIYVAFNSTLTID